MALIILSALSIFVVPGSAKIFPKIFFSEKITAVERPGEEHDDDAETALRGQDGEAVLRGEQIKSRPAHDGDEPPHDGGEPMLHTLEQERLFERSLSPIHHRKDHHGHEGNAADPDDHADNMNDEQNGQDTTVSSMQLRLITLHYFTMCPGFQAVLRRAREER